MLEAHGYDVDPIFRSRPEFNKKIDDFLYKEVGYDLLARFSYRFVSGPYSTTSLREYFAVGFGRVFYWRSEDILKQICPVLYIETGTTNILGG